MGASESTAAVGHLASYVCVQAHARQELGLTFKEFLTRVEIALDDGLQSAEDVPEFLKTAAAPIEPT